MKKFKYTQLVDDDIVFEVKSGDQFIGYITKRRYNYAYGRTLDEVKGYTKTRVEAADALSELART